MSVELPLLPEMPEGDWSELQRFAESVLSSMDMIRDAIAALAPAGQRTVDEVTSEMEFERRYQRQRMRKQRRVRRGR